MSALNEKAKKLAEACDAAYLANKESCSNAVTAVIQAVHDPKYVHRQANTLVDWMRINWSEVVLEDGFLAANQGVVVVGGKQETNANGHVVVIYPGEKIFNGGYQYFWKKGNKFLTMPGKAKYPRCMSTSKGSWPGAMSCGEKTVWDPWGDDKKFELVGFWTPIWPLPS